MSTLESLLMGAVSMSSLIVALFFLRFWVRTRDTFFLLFSAAFAIEGVNRLVIGLAQPPNEDGPLFYLPRLFAFSLIVLAVILKNQPGRR